MIRSHYYNSLGTYLQFVFVSICTLKFMSKDVMILNKWFASLESCAEQKLYIFVPSGLMLCVLLLFVDGSVLLCLDVCWSKNTEVLVPHIKHALHINLEIEH
jgi:hypothetical protein